MTPAPAAVGKNIKNVVEVKGGLIVLADLRKDMEEKGRRLADLRVSL